MRGKLYGIGVGPGDPELLTLKAKRILEAADVVAVPVKEKGEQSTALEIIRPVVSLDDKEILEVVFRMAKEKEERKRCRAEAGKQLTDILDQGKTVAMITLGDVARLADVLGHSSIETTRLYLISSGEEHLRDIRQEARWPVVLGVSPHQALGGI